MNATEFTKLLRDLGACSEARSWAKGKDLHEVWTSCERADWLLWLAGRMADKPGWPTRKQIVLAACACAETALKFVKPGEDRPRLAIETARAWTRGEATIEDVRRARAAAVAAAAAYSADAAATAAYSAAYTTATATAAYSDDAAAAAAAAAYTTATAAYSADAAARTEARMLCLAIIRRELGEPQPVEKVDA
jgi:hypothetical protein